MSRPLLLLLAMALSAPLLTAQFTVGARDVGLTIDGVGLNVRHGQSCGAFTCKPFPSPSLIATNVGGHSRVVTVFGAPNSVFVLAISDAAATCQLVSGTSNALLLGRPAFVCDGLPAFVVAIGITSAVLPTSIECRQGLARYVLTVPVAVPTGLTFRLQAMTTSATTGGAALTVAIQTSVG